MAYELTIKKDSVYQNNELERLTSEMASAISAVGAMAERTKIMCARHLHTIDANELYKEDGFESAKDFAVKVMGMSSANAYAYIQVGREINSDRIPLFDKVGREFNFTQLRALCAIKEPKKLNESIESECITADMSGKEIDDEVRSINPAKKARKAKEEKRFNWYLDGIKGKQDFNDVTESEFAGYDWQGIEKVSITVKSDDTETKVSGYLVMHEGAIRFFAKGEESKEVIDTEKSEQD